MSETNPLSTMIDKPNPVDAAPGAPLDWGVGSLLNVQADLLAGAEATVTDWLHRRREAVIETQQLIARMHIGSDPAEALKAQQEWMSHSFQRLAADADACHTATRQMMDRVISWFPHGGWNWFQGDAEGQEYAASQAAATRAAGRPLRVTSK